MFFFAKYWWPVWWVPTVRWRNNYFPHNKEALPCGCRGPSCQPLHVQYSSDGSRSLTTLTTPRREHHSGGRRQGLGRGRRGAGEDAAVEARAERSTRVHRFGAVLGCRCRRITGVWVSRGMPWPAVGVVGGAEACVAAQLATGGGSRRSRRRCFGGWSKKIRD